MSVPSSNMTSILKKVSMASISPKRMTGFMVVALILLILLGGMGWIKITEKEEYLVQRNFRLLKMWSHDISAKIGGYQQVFRFSAKGILDGLHNKIEFVEKNDQANRSRFVTTYNGIDSPNKEDTNNEAAEHTFILQKVSPWSCAKNSRVPPNSEPTQKSRAQTSESSSKEPLYSIIRNLELQLAKICLAEGLTTLNLSIQKNQKNDTDTENTENFKLSVNHSNNPPVIQLTYSKTMESDHEPESDQEKESIQIKGDIKLESFLTRLFNEAIFDEVLLFDSVSSTLNGEKDFPLLFDSGSQEFSWTNLQTIIENSEPSESFLRSLLSNPQDVSHFRQQLSDHNSPKQFLVKLPGKTNNAFTLPVIVSGNGNTAWRLVGMIDHGAFQNSYLAISSSLVLGVMFLILGLLLSIPFLHLKTMGAKDPLRMSHVLTIFLAAVLGTGSFTFLVLDLAVYDEGTDTLREKMQSSAGTIKKSVHQELESILSTLTRFDQSDFLKDDKKKVKIDEESETVKNVGERPVLLEVLEQENPQTMPNRQCNALPITERQQCYPDFLSAFWMDQDGSLRINWAKTTALGLSTNVSLRGRDYVKNVLDTPGSLWKISQKSGQDDAKAKHFQFFLEPIISWTTGENTVVASMASQNVQQKPNGWVAAMEFKFVSLMDQLVLPPGIGFAVIENNTHRVLFHSKEGRNLREGFLVETDQNQQLRDHLTARTPGHVNGSYWGKARSFYTLPLEPLPWALVVYRDREILQSVNLFGLVIAGGVYSLWSFIVYLIAGIFLRRNSKHRKAVCLWPNSDNHHLYVKLMKSNLVVFFVGLYSLWMLSGQPGWQLVTALLIIPSASLIGSVILVKIFPQIGNASSSSPSLRNSYAYLATSFLLVFSVIPAFGCFSSMFHKEMTLFTQYQLLETFKSFQDSGKQQTLQSQEILPPPLTFRKIAFKPGCETPSPKANEPTPIDPSYGFYPNFLLDTRWSNCVNGGQPQKPTQIIFDQFFALVSQPFLPLLKNVPLWGFIEESWPVDDNSSDKSINKHQSQRPIRWDTENEKFFVLLKDSPTQVGSALPLQTWFLSGNGPDLGSVTFGKTIKYFLITVLLIFLIITIPKFIATRTVFLNFPTPFQVPQDLLFAQPSTASSWSNQLILGFPGQGKTPKASPPGKEMEQKHAGEKEPSSEETNAAKEANKIQQNKLPPFYYDLKAIPPEKWKKDLSDKISQLKLADNQDLHVIIDHLERQWKDPVINLKKLELMEWLLNRSNHRKDPPSFTSNEDHIQTSQKSKLGDLFIQVLTKIVSHDKS